MEVITSRQNGLILRMGKLQDRKYREKERLFLLDGIKLCVEAILAGVEILYVFLRSDTAQKVTERIDRETDGKLENLKNAFVWLDGPVFDKLSAEKSPEGVICVAKYIDKWHKIITINNVPQDMASWEPENDQRVMLVESVRDPGNLGTIIRSAAAFGIDRLVISIDCADLYHAKTVRASMGTLFHQRIDLVEDLPEYIRRLAQKRRVFGAALGQDAALLGHFPLRKDDCIVIGNEGHGLTDQTLAVCTNRLLIPMVPGTESLNAAMAATVCMWEMFRG